MRHTIVYAALAAGLTTLIVQTNVEAKPAAAKSEQRSAQRADPVFGTSAKVSVNVHKAPLREVVSRVAKLGQVNVVGLDRIPESAVVSIRMADRPETVLRRLLEGRDVMFVQGAGGGATVAILDRDKSLNPVTDAAATADAGQAEAQVPTSSSAGAHFGARILREANASSPQVPASPGSAPPPMASPAAAAVNNGPRSPSSANVQALAAASIIGDAGSSASNPVIAAQERVKAMVSSLNRAAELNKADNGGSVKP